MRISAEMFLYRLRCFIVGAYRILMVHFQTIKRVVAIKLPRKSELISTRVTITGESLSIRHRFMPTINLRITRIFAA